MFAVVSVVNFRVAMLQIQIHIMQLRQRKWIVFGFFYTYKGSLPKYSETRLRVVVRFCNLSQNVQINVALMWQSGVPNEFCRICLGIRRANARCIWQCDTVNIGNIGRL